MNEFQLVTGPESKCRVILYKQTIDCHAKLAYLHLYFTERPQFVFLSGSHFIFPHKYAGKHVSTRWNAYKGSCVALISEDRSYVL